MDRRLYFVLLAGLAIVGVCVYRLRANRPLDFDAQVAAATTSVPAPLFEGVDENNTVFRLSSYLGRHRIILAFYDGAVGADRSRELLTLRDRAEELKRQDVKVVGISTAIPQENRRALKALGALSFPLVSDVDGSIHRHWGRWSAANQPLAGLFLIDRKGTVAFHAGAPRPYSTLEALWKDLDR
ncbi:MAG: redoxin domain-containing protein [Planctomycetaceae bacterium]